MNLQWCICQGVRNSKEILNLQDFKGFEQDFRFKSHRIWSIFDHVFSSIRRCTRIYWMEFTLRSHAKLCDTKFTIVHTLTTKFTVNKWTLICKICNNFLRFQISTSAEIEISAKISKRLYEISRSCGPLGI